MTPAKGDAAQIEKLLAESGNSRMTVTGGASSIVISSADDAGVQRERFRFVAIPNHKYRVEIAEGGRWRNAAISGLIENVVPATLKAIAGKKK